MRGRRRSKLTRDERQREDSRKFLPDAVKNARSLGSLLLMVRNGSSLRHYGALWLPIKWRRLGIAPLPDTAELRAPIVEPVLESFAGSPVRRASDRSPVQWRRRLHSRRLPSVTAATVAKATKLPVKVVTLFAFSGTQTSQIQPSDA